MSSKIYTYPDFNFTPNEKTSNNFYNCGYDVFSKMIDGTLSPNITDIKMIWVNIQIALCYNKINMKARQVQKDMCTLWHTEGGSSPVVGFTDLAISQFNNIACSKFAYREGKIPSP